MKENFCMGNFRAWLTKAQDDLLWTESSIRGHIWYGACFTAQQSAEKSIKAYLVFHKKAVPKIHDLRALLAQCIAMDQSFEAIRESAISLLPYYIETRYLIGEGELFDFTEAQARQALSDAQAILDFVKTHLP